MATSIDPKSLRVVDLKEELGKRNLAKTGKKDELVARLTEALATEAAPTPTETEAAAPTEMETEAAAAAPAPTEMETKAPPPIEEQDVSMPPPTMEETEPLTEKTINVPTTTDDKTQAELSTTIELQAQVNDVIESPSLDTTITAKEEEQVAPTPEKSSEDSTTQLAPLPTATNDQPPQPIIKSMPEAPDTDDQTTTLKRKREEPLQTEEDKRTRTESKSSITTDTKATGEQNAVCIKGFVRPLITKHLQEFIKQYGNVKRFWIDPIKTHCYIIYDTLDEAANAFQNINNTVYPPTNTGKQVTALLLTSSQATQLMDREQQVADNHGRANWEKLLERVLNNEAIDEPTSAEQSPSGGKRRLGGLEQITRQLQQRGAVSAIMDQEKPSPPSILDRLSTTTPTTSQVTIAGVAASMNKEGKSLDDLFLKTKANPPLYYLPVDKDIAARRLEDMKRKVD